MSKLKIVEWFGGIGAATTAFKRLGMDYQIVDYVELDKHAVKSYNFLNDTDFRPQDINDINPYEYGPIDILIAGWPCQDLSIAGKQKGLDKGNRSGLIWTTIIKIMNLRFRPKVIILENVKGLLNKKHKKDFDYIISLFTQMGYYFSYKLLNAKYFGVPQNRERVYCVLTKYTPIDSLFGKTHFKWEWTEVCNEVEVKLKDILDKDAEWQEAETFVEIGKYGYINATERQLELKSSYKRYWNVEGDYIGAVTASVPPKIYFKEEKSKILYRNLTARECWKLMGFTEQEFNELEGHISNNQLCKQAGNSIVVNVLASIFYELYQSDYGNNKYLY